MAAKLRRLGSKLKLVDTRAVKPGPKVGDPFYKSGPWRKLMSEIIAERGYRCEDPEHSGDRSISGMIYGDHVIERQDGGADLDKGNVLLRCPSCHTRKTLRVRAQRMGAPSPHPPPGGGR